jgi:hypothetical protein
VNVTGIEGKRMLEISSNFRRKTANSEKPNFARKIDIPGESVGC